MIFQWAYQLIFFVWVDFEPEVCQTSACPVCTVEQLLNKTRQLPALPMIYHIWHCSDSWMALKEDQYCCWLGILKLNSSKRPSQCQCFRSVSLHQMPSTISKASNHESNRVCKVYNLNSLNNNRLQSYKLCEKDALNIEWNSNFEVKDMRGHHQIIFPSCLWKFCICFLTELMAMSHFMNSSSQKIETEQKSFVFPSMDCRCFKTSL